MFFPDSYGGKEAEAICNTCEVQPECLQYAIETRPVFGVWGGKTRSRRLKAVSNAKKSQVQAQDQIQSAAS